MTLAVLDARQGPLVVASIGENTAETARLRALTAEDRAEAAASAAVAVAAAASFIGGAAASNQILKEWTEAGSWEATALTRNSDGVVTSATVKWPDGSAGTFTATTINATWASIDAFTISHTASGKTVTQAAVTRNTAGEVTAKPALTVA